METHQERAQSFHLAVVFAVENSLIEILFTLF